MIMKTEKPAPTRWEVLTNPATHKIIFDVLDLADKCDIVDAIHDIDLALAILKGEFEEMANYPMGRTPCDNSLAYAMMDKK
jgi:hypothetical protein